MQFTRTIVAPGLRIAKHGFPFLAAVTCLWLLSHQLAALDTAALAAGFSQIAPVQWALALLATCASFWAVGRYDAVLHRHFNTGVALDDAVKSGAAAIAFSQTVGFGLLSGSFARWRMLPGPPLATTASITLLCALSFLLALGFIIAFSCLLLMPQTAYWALPAVAAFLLVPVFALLKPTLSLPFGKRLTLPSLPAMGALTGLTFLDTLFAALALLILLPGGGTIGMTQLLPAFLLALGAGILSGSPAGLGPFELALFALLPQLPEPSLAAGILAFRLVYYAIPAALAGLFLAFVAPQKHTRAVSPLLAPLVRPSARVIAHAKRSELGVVRQNGAELLRAAGSAAYAVKTPQTLTALFDPAEGRVAALLPSLKQSARDSNRLPVLYKCSARIALSARASGFALAHIADEALINPQSFNLAGPAHRQLRRKLRQAAKSDVHITCPSVLPFADMEVIDTAWSARNKGARGFSMGRFERDYLAGHLVYLAHQGSRLIGFVSFHVSAHELCLDLMRSSDDAPSGTMHALICQAIGDASKSGRTKLSLAALPARHNSAYLGRLISHISGSAGLAQFKDSFSPRYSPLYIAAPTRFSLAIAMVDLARSIQRPDSGNRAPAFQQHARSSSST